MFVLDKLWQEGLSPNERYTRKGSEYHKILLRICEEGDYFATELTEEGKAHFDAYRDAQIGDLVRLVSSAVHISSVYRRAVLIQRISL